MKTTTAATQMTHRITFFDACTVSGKHSVAVYLHDGRGYTQENLDSGEAADWSFDDQDVIPSVAVSDCCGANPLKWGFHYAAYGARRATLTAL